MVDRHWLIMVERSFFSAVEAQSSSVLSSAGCACAWGQYLQASWSQGHLAAKEPGAAWNECHDVMDSYEGTSEQLHVTICCDHDMQLYEIMMNAASSLTASGFSAMVFHAALSQDRAYRSTELIQSTPEFKIKARQQWGLSCSHVIYVLLMLLMFCLCHPLFQQH